MPTRIHTVVASVVFVLVCAGLSGRADAQVVNPATAQPGDPSPVPSSGHLHTWELPPITVQGQAPADVVEEQLIGDYAQPRWTAHRRFSETRVYVIPRGMSDVEYWLIPEKAKHGPTEWKSQYEMEFGLPGRIQLDLYAVAHKTGYKEESFAIDEQNVEVRWALAGWNRIWGNPTVYLEWNQVSNAPDHVEGKLLFGGEMAPRWHWGSNLVWEHELAGGQENSNEWTTGVSYTLKDSRFGIGVETQLALVNSLASPGHRGPFAKEFLVGPSLQWRPLPQAHLDFAPLFGATKDAARAKTFVVFGWEF